MSDLSAGSVTASVAEYATNNAHTTTAEGACTNASSNNTTTRVAHPQSNTGVRPRRSETTPAGSAMTILTRLAAAHTRGTHLIAMPASVAHNTTNTSGTLANASHPAATIIARNRLCSLPHENGTRSGATKGWPAGSPKINNSSTRAPGMTDARNTCCRSACMLNSAN